MLPFSSIELGDLSFFHRSPETLFESVPFHSQNIDLCTFLNHLVFDLLINNDNLQNDSLNIILLSINNTLRQRVFCPGEKASGQVDERQRMFYPRAEASGRLAERQ
jgi:hypothetical protein